MSRQAFENWMTDEGKWPAAIEMADGNYKLSTASQSWKVWQAATDAALERAEKVCEAIENDKWALYKGRKPYTGKEPGRASDYVQGQSDGAGDCAEAIRALKDES